MSDPFLNRAENIKKTLLAMESEAPDNDLFALGYMIPQIELVQEMAQYDPEDVTGEDFDATYRQWLESTFMEDAMASDDRQRIEELWQSAMSRTA
ncbi:YfcL family protein [Kushneria indalinina]|uniref:YfcL protein n=1 Tax=Kushneria indalinina DSM 14324 TaxID=1122140 RepID=A0A3D9DZS6_9GAMM|nr:YfcL family protein [Kushneria indalinina]REC96287.1 YfcL protein [Kushneria indalinina DSM 14324]